MFINLSQRRSLQFTRELHIPRQQATVLFTANSTHCFLQSLTHYEIQGSSTKKGRGWSSIHYHGREDMGESLTRGSWLVLSPPRLFLHSSPHQKVNACKQASTASGPTGAKHTGEKKPPFSTFPASSLLSNPSTCSKSYYTERDKHVQRRDTQTQREVRTQARM